MDVGRNLTTGAVPCSGMKILRKREGDKKTEGPRRLGVDRYGMLVMTETDGAASLGEGAGQHTWCNIQHVSEFRATRNAEMERTDK